MGVRDWRLRGMATTSAQKLIFAHDGRPATSPVSVDSLKNSVGILDQHDVDYSLHGGERTQKLARRQCFGSWPQGLFELCQTDSAVFRQVASLMDLWSHKDLRAAGVFRCSSALISGWGTENFGKFFLVTGGREHSTDGTAVDS